MKKSEVEELLRGKNRCGDLVDQLSFFSAKKTIVRNSDWHHKIACKVANK